jgi:hypothetical protein
VPIVLKSGGLNLLEASGPVKACNGIALPFTMFHLMSVTTHPTTQSHIPEDLKPSVMYVTYGKETKIHGHLIGLQVGHNKPRKV